MNEENLVKLIEDVDKNFIGRKEAKTALMDYLKKSYEAFDEDAHISEESDDGLRVELFAVINKHFSPKEIKDFLNLPVKVEDQKITFLEHFASNYRYLFNGCGNIQKAAAGIAKEKELQAIERAAQQGQQKK